MEHLIAAIDPELSSAAGGSPPFEPSSPERSAHCEFSCTIFYDGARDLIAAFLFVIFCI